MSKHPENITALNEPESHDIRFYVKAFKVLIDEVLRGADRERAFQDIVGSILPEAKKDFPPHLYQEIREYAEARLGVKIDDELVEKASKSSPR